MNSFTLTAIGNLSRNPELTVKGDRTYAKFCLIGNDYAGKDEEGGAREIATSIWFTAFGSRMPFGRAISLEQLPRRRNRICLRVCAEMHIPRACAAALSST